MRFYPRLLFVASDHSSISVSAARNAAISRDFAKSAPRRLRHDVLRVLGDAVHEKISDAPLWVSTNGAGVAWLHVRLDSTPKYYSYRPYTKLLLNGYDDAVKLEKDSDSEDCESESR